MGKLNGRNKITMKFIQKIFYYNLKPQLKICH